jgi:hypothetical protein
MPRISEDNTNFIKGYIDWFSKHIEKGLQGPISADVGEPMPPDVLEVVQQVDQLYDVFREKDALAVDLPESLIPIFKRMMIEVRRKNVSKIESRKEATHHPFLLKTLDEKQKPIDDLMAQDWLRDVIPMRIPLLREYIPLKRVEELRPASIKLREREYDQKFRILQSPGLIIDDLHHYREIGEFRGTPVTVAFIDIDDFKKNFNEKYGEIEIDRRVLPVLMSQLEAHVFNHGFAYRHGGDEFVLVLPNMSLEVVTVFLDTLRRSNRDSRVPPN